MRSSPDRFNPRIFFALSLMFSIAAAVSAADGEAYEKTVAGPDKRDVKVSVKSQLVYALTLFDGYRYTATFAPEQIGTIHMIADADNLVVPHRTGVYYWPITGEYMADWLNTVQNDDLSLELCRSGRVIEVYKPRDYALAYAGPTDQRARLLVGEAAVRETQRYQEEVDNFRRELIDFFEKLYQYDKDLQDFMNDPAKFGGKAPQQPIEPAAPSMEVTEIRSGFIINCPPGVYEIRLRAADGRIVPRSTKKLNVFTQTARGIGYQIIPEDKWTRPLMSNDRGGNIYALPGQVIYLKPFAEAQYNSHDYAKLTELPKPSSGRGLENERTWVHLNPLAKKAYTLELLRGGRVVKRIEDKPYYVQQRPGNELGYDILEFGRGDLPADTVPTFTAFKVVMPSSPGNYQMRLVDSHGRALEESRRELCTIKQPKAVSLLLVALIVPMLLGVSTLAWGRMRRRAFRD